MCVFIHFFDRDGETRRLNETWRRLGLQDVVRAFEPQDILRVFQPKVFDPHQESGSARIPVLIPVF